MSTVAAGLISVEVGSGAVSETDGSGEGEGVLVVVLEVAAVEGQNECNRAPTRRRNGVMTGAC